MPRRLVPLLLALVVATGCTGDIDNADPALSLVGGRADCAEARAIRYGETLSGQVAGHAFSLFSLEVDDGDAFTVTVRRTSGDFDPRIVVYGPTLDPIAHEPGSFERIENGNKKSFRMGQYATSVLVLVRADRYEGSGDFDLTVECTGGPCAGEVPHGDNEWVQIGICLGRARSCAFARLDEGPVAEGTRARSLLAECLAAEADCSPEMCDIEDPSGESPRRLCGELSDALVFYSSRSPSCRSVLTDCMDSCGEYEENSEFLEYDDEELDFWMVGEAICWFNRYGTTCDELARGHEACGGSDYREIDGTETAGTCFAYWRATEGAWYEFEDDNIDCSHVCDAVDEECSERCEGDDPDSRASCYRSCVADHPLLQDDDAYVCDL